MTDVEIDEEEIKRLGRDIVLKARRENNLKSLTKRSVRDEIEAQLSLSPGSLNPYKVILSRVIENAQVEKLEPHDHAVGPSNEKTKKRKLEEARSGHTPQKMKDANKDPENELSGTVQSSSNHKSESEMSSVIDELPKKKRKSKPKDVSNKSKREAGSASRESVTAHGSDAEVSTVEDAEPKKRARKSETSKVIDKDGETIKKLKSFVVACGLRKVWSKEFKNYPTPRQQISRLKEILKELGMPSRPSMTEAKKIRERREIMQDVEAAKEYEKLRGAKSDKSKSREPAPESKSDSEASAMPEKPAKVSTVKSIMAFLDEESD